MWWLSYRRTAAGGAASAALILALGGAGAVVSYVSGNAAVDAIAGLPRTSARALEQHHARAGMALGLALGAAAIAAIATLRRRERAVSVATVTLLLAITGAALAGVTWTSLAGGRVNHPEIRRDNGEAVPARHHHE